MYPKPSYNEPTHKEVPVNKQEAVDATPLPR